MSESLQLGFTVGPYRVLPRQNRLEGPDGEHHVEPKVMEVLLALARHPGELVSRQDLLDDVWGDVVVLDETLTKAIQVLRSHLGDNPSSPRFIRTVPRRGYQLIAPVGSLDDARPGADAGSLQPGSPSERSAGAGSARTRRRAGWIIGLALAGLAAVVTYFTTGPAAPAVTLAVIPPVESGGSANLGFVGEGLADYLIDQLSRTGRLEVVARRSSFGMRETDTNVRAIGEQLGARYLVEGSLREEGSDLLLTLFLVDADSGTNVWTTQVRGPAGDVAYLQRRSATQLREALNRELGVAIRPIDAEPSRIPEAAYRKYLEARYQWTLRGERRIDRSIALLEAALALEPDYAAAHLALAQSVAVKPFYTDEPVASQFEQARASSARAVSLDPSLKADVSALEGFMRFKERRWTEARDALRQALDLKPDNVNALYWYSWLLSQIGRYDEALSYVIRAQKLDPVSAVLNDRLAIAYVWVDDLEKAAERYEVAADLGYLESTQPLSTMMFLNRAARFEELTDLLLRLGGDPAWVGPTVAALRHPEQRAATSELIDDFSEPDPLLDTVRFGIWYLFGETDRAFRDFDPGPKSPYVEALWSPEAANLRSDPRFESLLVRLGFTGEDRSLLPGY